MRRVQGRVKWFNNDKEYGFISVQNAPDVFVHYSTILMDGFKNLQEGDLVEFEVVQGARGPMASGVTQVGVTSKEMPRIHGVVKWFNDSEGKGYGFIRRDGAPDVFVHYSDILMRGYKSLLQGDAVEFSVVAGVHGPVAMRVMKLGEANGGTGPQETRPQDTEAQGSHDPGKPRSAWEVLGVPMGASLGEISRAYHHAAQMYHPDKVAGLGPEFGELAERRMKEINAAFQELKRQAKSQT